MQIVIDIPEDEHNYIKDFKGTNSTITGRLYEAVYHGTVLSEPHGRLIDADVLLKHKTDHEYISTHLIYNAPTIIEGSEVSE